MVDNKMVLDEDLDGLDDKELILRSDSAIGHGVMNDIYDIVYIKTKDYSASNNPAIADEMEKINRTLLNENREYALIGPGRWGSSDQWLGIPVKWPAISGARVIIECGLTHFFQNLTSLGVAYYTINPYKGDGMFNEEYLNSLPAIEETEYIRHVRFNTPCIAKVDGVKKKGVLIKANSN